MDVASSGERLVTGEVVEHVDVGAVVGDRRERISGAGVIAARVRGVRNPLCLPLVPDAEHTAELLNRRAAGAEQTVIQ